MNKSLFSFHNNRDNIERNCKLNINKDSYGFFNLDEEPLSKFITNEFSFSENFIRIIGNSNYKNVSGLEDDPTKHLFYTAYLNRLANSNSNYLNDCLSYKNCPPVFEAIFQDEDGFLRSDLVSKKLQKDSYNKDYEHLYNHATWPGIIKNKFHLPYLEAIVLLSRTLNINYKNIFSIAQFQPCFNSVKSGDCFFPNNLRYPLWNPDTPSFIISSIKNIISSTEDVVSSIVKYKFGKDEFCIFIPQSSSYRVFGAIKPIAYFLNDHKFEIYPTATVFLFNDMRTAFMIQDILDQSKYDKRAFIVSSFLGDNFNLYSWSYFLNAKLIYVPSATVRGIDNIHKFERCCNDIGIKDYRVSKQFVLRNEGIETDLPNELGSDAEDYILKNSIFLTENTDILPILDKIDADSMAVKDCHYTFSQLGIFKNTCSNITANIKRKVAPVPPDPRLLPPIAHKLEDVTANHIFRPKNIVMIVGEKNSGKTLLGMLSSKSVLQIEDKIFPFNKISPASLGNICLVDAETPFDELQDHIRIHGLDKYINNKLYIISRLDPNNSLLATYDITNPQVREILNAKMKEFGCKLLILDNLTAMMGSKVDNAASAQAVLDWFEQLQDQNICIIFVLHKPSVNTKTGSDRNRGSQLFRDRARVIINLLSKKEILTLKEEGKPIPEKTIAEISKPSLTVGIEFSVCKSAPVIEGHTIWTKMPFGSSFEPISITDHAGEEVTWQNSSQPNSILEYVLTLYPQVKHDRITALTEKKLKVIKALDRCAGEAKMQDIMDNIGTQKGLKEDTVRNILKELSELELVENDGENQSRRYKISG